MTELARCLHELPALRGVPEREVAAIASLWSIREVAPGGLVWAQGDPVDGLAAIVGGELDVELDDVVVGRVRQGELLGESSAFIATQVRSVTLRARGPATLAVLPTRAIRDLRDHNPGTYTRFLELGQHALVRRLHVTNQRLTVAIAGTRAIPTRPQPSRLARWWDALVHPEPPTDPPSLGPLLRRLPCLGGLDGPAVAAFARAFSPMYLPERHVLFLQGEASDGAWLVADAEMEILRNVRGSHAEALATAGAGTLVGVNALVEQGARGASVVVTRPGWAFLLTREAVARALHGPVRVRWEECVLAALAAQSRNADVLLRQSAAPGVAAGEGAAGGEAELSELLRASGWIESLPPELRDVELASPPLPPRVHHRAAS